MFKKETESSKGSLGDLAITIEKQANTSKQKGTCSTEIEKQG